MTKQEQYLAQMAGVEEFRLAVNALVAGLVSDGFSNEQARDIVAGFFRLTGQADGSA